MRSRAPRPGRPFAWGALAGLLLALPLAAGSPSSWGAPAPHAAVHPAGACPGASIASSYRGQLNVTDPFESPPSVANRTVVASYEFQENITSDHVTTISCLPYNATASTGPTGAFTLTPTVPTGRCGGAYCQVDTGPFGPVSFTLRNATPPGDLLRVDLRGTYVGLLWTRALASVSIDPSGPQVLSAEAPTNFSALALAGDGGPSPATLATHWVVRGTGWTLLGNATDPAVQLEGAAGASNGSLVLFANGSYLGTGFGFAPFVDALADVATTLGSASLSPVALDAGVAATVQLAGQGAAGYNYTAELAPGAGLAPQALACRSAPASLPSVLALTCAGRYTYADPGNETPLLSLTNGFSAANRSLPEVDVAPALSVVATPVAAAGYVGRPLSFAVAIGPGEGTPPYGPVCLAPGAGPTVCRSGGDGPWNLSARYPSPGSFDAELSVADAAGANRSVEVPVTIADVPDLGAVQSDGNTVNTSSPLDLSAPYGGGLLPAWFWWNDTTLGTTLASGVVGADGTLALRFLSALPGYHALTLTVVDGLGSRNTSGIGLSVNAGPAAGLVAAGGALPSAVRAGTPWNLSVRMVTTAGITVTAYEGTVPVTLAGPGTAAAADWSGRTGALTAPSEGPLLVPSADWSDGYLNLSLTLTVAGAWNLSLGGGGVPGPPLELTVPVVADPLTERLLDPRTIDGGTRQNATLWTIVDGFGNPVLNGYVVVQSVFPSGSFVDESPVEVTGGIGRVWVNVTPLGSGAGTVWVRNPATGAWLLPAIAVPAAPSPTLTPTSLLLFLAGGALVAVGAAAVARRAFRRRPGPPDPSEELERHAAGRDHLLVRLAEGPTASWKELGRGWTGPRPPPTPAELGEWLSALVAEGAVQARRGPGGRPVFSLAGAPDGPAGVTLDAGALERALARRDGAGPSDDAWERP